MSSRISLRRSPKSGALIATVFKVPRALFTIKVANASPSISSAMITNGLFWLDTASKIGNNSFTVVNFLSAIKTRASLIVVLIELLSVTKYGDL